MQPYDARVTVPPGMAAVDDDAVVRIDSITAIMRTETGGSQIRIGSASITVDCTLEELLRRIDAQIPRKL